MLSAVALDEGRELLFVQVICFGFSIGGPLLREDSLVFNSILQNVVCVCDARRLIETRNSTEAEAAHFFFSSIASVTCSAALLP